jgi:hypothetical protein
MLRRMANRKEIRVWSFPDYDKPDWFLLNATPKKRASQYFHEAADVFSLYASYLFSKGGGWGYEPKVGSDRADRGMEINRLAYLEVDMGSENMEVICQKIDRYAAYSLDSGDEFSVIFDFVGQQQKAEDRLGKTLAYAARKEGNCQFVATTHPYIEATPFEAIYLTPRMEFLTITQLLADVIWPLYGI